MPASILRLGLPPTIIKCINSKEITLSQCFFRLKIGYISIPEYGIKRQAIG